jgi:isocitrate dehydrogenase
MAMYNLDDSIRDFAPRRRCATARPRLPVYLSTKNTIMKRYDGRFKDLFEEIFDSEFKADFEAGRLTYEHRLDRRHGRRRAEVGGRLRVGVQELRRRRAVDTVAQGFGSLGLMTERAR